MFPVFNLTKALLNPLEFKNIYQLLTQPEKSLKQRKEK
jgi:hypothetical protein